METKVRKRTAREVLRGNLLSIVFFIVIFALFLGGIADAKRSSAAEGKRVVEENLHKAVVSCYALEGAYPSSLAYLEDNYGFKYDKDKYVVFYSAFASNIMPDMSVTDISEGVDANEKA